MKVIKTLAVVPLIGFSVGMVALLGLFGWGCYPKNCDPKTDRRALPCGCRPVRSVPGRHQGRRERRMRKSWDEYFIGLAHAAATRATCDRKHVGCVLVVDKRMIASGYNGSVPGQEHCDDVGHDMLNGHCVRTVHAEVNAVAQAARLGISTKGSSAFVNTYPCWPCFKVMLSAGIVEVVYDDEYRNDERVAASAQAAGVVVRRLVR